MHRLFYALRTKINGHPKRCGPDRLQRACVLGMALSEKEKK